MTLGRRAAAEALGTALLAAIVLGSGIMAQRLAGPDVALALLANTLATGAGLIALILTFGPISGAHLNPVVTLWAAVSRELGARDAAIYLAAQVAGALAGAVLANLMFDLPAVTWATTARGGPALLLAEAVATFGLVAVVQSTSRRQPAATPFAVGLYIMAGYWFTSSTAFANPALTAARALTDTFGGTRPADVPALVAVELAGAAAAVVVFRWLLTTPPVAAPRRT